MKHALFTLLICSLFLSACKTGPDYLRPLPEGSPALLPLGPEDAVPAFAGQWEERDDIVPALNHSIAWTERRYAERFFPQAGITHERALGSLLRFREALETSTSAEDFQRTIESEFTIYKSAGWDGRGGGVLFTAYCTPILRGSLEQSATYRYPLYALPPDLVKDKSGATLGWETAMGLLPNYPSRGAIEAGGLLTGKGLELVWLSDPIDAYLAHVNGSAFIQLTDGTELRLGYAGKNGRDYRSIGKELASDRKIEGEPSLEKIREWASTKSDEEVNEYLHRNASYVFFTPIDGNPHGSLDVEVTTGRSIATDKSLFPRGAVVFVEGASTESLGPYGDRFYLDQDTGGAIRTAGRADLYFGIGSGAEELAGRTKAEGQMYYFFLEK